MHDLVDALRAAGVQRVVDVRDLPASGIVHERRRELGNPAAIRAVYRSGDAARGPELDRARLLGERAWALDALADAAAERPTAMLCLEADQARCHRDVIAQELARLHPQVPVEPLAAGA